MNKKQISVLAIVGATAVFAAISYDSLIGHNDIQNWQIVQSPTGNVSVENTAGFYMKNFATVTTYPRVSQFPWGPVRVTFNDGGTAQISGTMRFGTPNSSAQRELIHTEFVTDIIDGAVRQSINDHLINVLKVTGPVMSGSEHQSARKGEFYNLVQSQLKEGLYQTRKTTKIVTTGDSETTIIATEIVDGDNGQPLVSEESPLIQYGITIKQFSIAGTEYDPKTLELFASKKESLLNAEKSKAAREEEVQERLMIVERGLKQLAEVEAEANMKKGQLTIEAETQVAIAQEQALQAEQEQIKQGTEAETRRLVAELDLASEKLRAEGVIVAAVAEEERITKAGAITEKERVLAQLDVEARIGVANALKDIKSPNIVIAGGEGEGGGSSTFEHMINLFMMDKLGVLTPSDYQIKAASKRSSQKP